MENGLMTCCPCIGESADLNDHVRNDEEECRLQSFSMGPCRKCKVQSSNCNHRGHTEVLDRPVRYSCNGQQKSEHSHGQDARHEGLHGRPAQQGKHDGPATVAE